MKAIQKVLLVTTGPAGATGLAEVNEHLRAGWYVAEMAPLGGGGQTEGFAGLVLLERGGEATSLLARLEEEVEDSLEGNGSRAGLLDEEE